jgi:hypothetical protein
VNSNTIYPGVLQPENDDTLQDGAQFLEAKYPLELKNYPSIIQQLKPDISHF